MTRIQIVDRIINYVNEVGGFPSEWYVGISRDARSRLFIDHGVYEYIGAWTYCTAYSSLEAREAEKHLIHVLGFDGGPGGGDDTSRMVYAYKKTLLTTQ